MLSFQRWFLPKSLKYKSKDEQIRTKFLAVNSSAALVWGPAMVPVVVYLDSPVSALIVAFGALISFSGAILLKYFGNLIAASSFYLGGIFIMLTMLSLINGGTNFSGFIWLLMLPILATNSISDKAGIITLFACLALLLGLKVAEHYGAVFPSETSSEGHDLFRYLSLIIVCTMLWAIGLSYSRLMQTALRNERELNQAKTNFISNVSHELRTPLNGIIGMLEVIGQKDIDERLMEDLNTIHYSSMHLMSLVNEILELGKVHLPQKFPPPRRYDIRKNIRNVVNSLSPIARTKSINLYYFLDKNLPSELLGDGTKIDQLLMNILSNSIKFTTSGSVKLNLDYEILDNSKVSLLFRIEDTGIGIAEQDIKNLFDPFYQADGSYTQKQVGAGLGLAISKAIVEQNGGTIKVTSKPGEGTVFEFNIIQTLANKDYKKSTSIANIITADAPHAKIHALQKNMNYKILLVEDNLVNQMVLKRMLEFKGYTIVIAENGQIALEKLEQETFDVILMDIRMPVMDGLKCSRKMRDQLDMSVPIIAVTANASHQDRQDCLDAGINDVLAKPVFASALYEKLSQWIPG